jgi:hypothetical protein
MDMIRPSTQIQNERENSIVFDSVRLANELSLQPPVGSGRPSTQARSRKDLGETNF